MGETTILILKRSTALGKLGKNRPPGIEHKKRKCSFVSHGKCYGRYMDPR